MIRKKYIRKRKYQKNLFVISSLPLHQQESPVNVDERLYNIINNDLDTDKSMCKADAVLPLADWHMTAHGRKQMELAIKLNKPLVSRNFERTRRQ